MKNIAILGCTGSIGTQTLDVVRRNPELFHVSAIAANRSDELMEKQIEEFQPAVAVLTDEAAAERLKARYQGKTEILSGSEGLLEAAALAEVDTVVTSLMALPGWHRP